MLVDVHADDALHVPSFDVVMRPLIGTIDVDSMQDSALVVGPVKTL